MTTERPGKTANCDVLVIGAGAGGLSAAITARIHGLDVLVVEKEPVFGGATALSGGVLWIPGNSVSREAGQVDTREAARKYLEHEAAQHFDAAAVDAFLDEGPRMVDFFSRETCVRFVPTLYPDYHPDAPGGANVGRSILAASFDIRELGPDMKRLRRPLQTITFMGMMFNSSNADLKHFFRVTRSLRSAAYVARRLASHLKELMLYRRGVQVTSGNALAARLAKAALDLGIPIWTEAPALELIQDGETVTGAVVRHKGERFSVTARRGVVLAAGGFSHDVARLTQAFAHVARGGEHVSPVPAGNTGDGARLAESAGGVVPIRYAQPAAWMPVSKVPLKGGGFGVFPHLLDRYKPGVIAVTRHGLRFTNESNSYHDVGAAMIQACEEDADTVAWLVCDSLSIKKYGLGFAKPAPLPLTGLIRKGYLRSGQTLTDLAAETGIDAATLESTVSEYNVHAVNGKDPAYGRGSNAFNRYLADSDHQPNPAVGPLVQGPFYALQLHVGDLGTFDGIRTAVNGQVLRSDGSVVAGLFAVGNDRASVMGGNYPGAGITLGPIMTFGFITGKFLADVGLGGAQDSVSGK